MPDERVRYRTVDLEKSLRVTARQLQCWDERQIIVPERDAANVRLYTHGQGVLVGVVQRLRKCGFSHQALRKAVSRVQSKLIQSPRFLLVGCDSTYVASAQNESDAITAMLQLSRLGVAVVLVDVREISDRLVARPHVHAPMMSWQRRAS